MLSTANGADLLPSMGLISPGEFGRMCLMAPNDSSVESAQQPQMGKKGGGIERKMTLGFK